ncbi:DUF1840 domain-containing protein [Pelistega europaea]|uniref:DUF1840 domain-containing protein n=1 Tax=Pelistega europaea TaxID=106147 RepID=A0A7Y4L7Z2_9BURK|nr:DUF1840 domain-containing protein [Pelistega europaea]NOL48618.1 DUF1840 domain-containing protein [Pelistega europaea]
MLITFSSNSSADVLMLDKHALAVLKALGRDYDKMPAEGVITHEQLASSIDALAKAIAKDKETRADFYAEQEEREERGEEKIHPVLEPVDLARRAYPLMEMMKEALKKEKDYVVWRSANAW